MSIDTDKLISKSKLNELTKKLYNKIIKYIDDNKPTSATDESVNNILGDILVIEEDSDIVFNYITDVNQEEPQ